jgi:N-acetylneuraminic acid mutarotase
MDRMAQNTRQPEVLQELFEALGNDPFVIAECLARPMLAERLLAHPAVERVKQQSRMFDQTVAGADYTLPAISDPSGGCIQDTWTPTNLTGAPDGRVSHTAVWTGSEMIVWGGDDGNFFQINTGGRYNPSTDSWTATSTTNAPEARVYHTAVWTGSEMIIWGGENFSVITFYNTGGKYNPVTDSWTATSTTDAPEGRDFHTAVWTGSEMIVWGGFAGGPFFNTGGRYNPNTNSWTATSTANAPTPRNGHTAVWTGSEMIVWGGEDDNLVELNTGGRYDSSTDSWTATSTANAPGG